MADYVRGPAAPRAERPPQEGLVLPMLFKFRVSPWLWDLAWVGVLMFCAGFQALRARKNADRAPAPFVEQDFGHKELPIVFEKSYYFVQRAFYGQGPGIPLVD